MPINDALERAAHAIWSEQRKQEIASLAELQIDTSYLPKAAEIMLGSDRRTQIIVGFSAISKSLALGVRAHLKHSTERDRKEMLEGLGPLATDAAKLRLARLMGWMPTLIAEGVNSIRQARNLVAHDIVPAHEITFPSNMPIETKAHLDGSIKRMLDAANNGADAAGRERVYRPEHEVGLYALLLSLEALSAIMWGPARLRLGVRDQIITLPTFEEAPEWCSESQRNLARAVLHLTQPD